MDTNLAARYKKSKHILVTDRGGLLGCEVVRTAYCLGNRLILTHRPRSDPQKYYFPASGTHFYWRLGKFKGLFISVSLLYSLFVTADLTLHTFQRMDEDIE
jgi:hypothetical protein